MKYWLSTEGRQACQSKDGFTYVQGTHTSPSPHTNHFSFRHFSCYSKSTYTCVHVARTRTTSPPGRTSCYACQLLQRYFCLWSGMTYVLAYLSSLVHLLFIAYRSLWAVLLFIALPAILQFIEGAGVVMSRPNRILMKSTEGRELKC